ncbi:mechanosensitive ion channel, partial [Salmonella enterica subsp. enterica serovar Lubbock]|nr:mechanosensitive ion channel [Salmonella enterica subsp. enterica serovar Lubbock]
VDELFDTQLMLFARRLSTLDLNEINTPQRMAHTPKKLKHGHIEHFGMSLSGLLTFGGIGGIAVGMAGKDVLSNFFSGIMLYFDR